MPVELHPCYEDMNYLQSGLEYRLLREGMSNAELFAFLTSLCQYGSKTSPPATVKEAADELFAKNELLIMSGGLVASDGKLEIYPSCCCGLEGWREWYWVLDKTGSPWLGHDPSPWVENGDTHITIHADEGDGHEQIQVTYAELATAVNNARRDLEGFAGDLHKWLVHEQLQDADKLHDLICVSFCIGEENKERPPG